MELTKDQKLEIIDKLIVALSKFLNKWELEGVNSFDNLFMCIFVKTLLGISLNKQLNELFPEFYNMVNKDYSSDNINSGFAWIYTNYDIDDNYRELKLYQFKLKKCIELKNQLEDGN